MPDQNKELKQTFTDPETGQEFPDSTRPISSLLDPAIEALQNPAVLAANASEAAKRALETAHTDAAHEVAGAFANQQALAEEFEITGDPAVGQAVEAATQEALAADVDRRNLPPLPSS